MLYDNYKNKILKLSAVRDFVLRHKVAFCALLCAIIALFATFLGFKGKLLKPLNSNVSVAYGDEYKMGGRAFSAFIGYEYQKVGDDEWTEEKPTAPGEYLARGYALKGYGGRNYTETVGFTIYKRDVEIVINESTVTYGDGLSVSAVTAKGDGLDLSKIEIEKSEIINYRFTATPKIDSVVINNSDGENVTDYYNVTVRTVSVGVLKREITIKIGSAEKVYDGEYLSCEDYSLISGSTIEGETLQLDFNDRIKTFGVMENKPVWRVSSASGEEKSQFYDVQFESGLLSVKKRDITVKTDSDSKIYDGKPLYCPSFSVVSEIKTVSGDSIFVINSSSQTVYGSTPNEFNIAIINGDGENVTESYNVSYDLGILTVDKRGIKIKSQNATLIYNGQPQSYEQNTQIVSGSLAEGDIYYVSEYATIKNSGTEENEIKVRVYMADNTEVTDSYDISYEYGTLTVEKRNVTLAPQYAYREYDGTPLTSNEYAVLSGSLASGHYAEIETDGSLTEYGTKTNSITSYKIFDYEGNEVTENYNVQVESSALNVLKRNVTVKVDDEQKVYDGEPLLPLSYSIVRNTLVAGHEIVIGEYSGSQTDVGVAYASIVSFSVVDEFNNDVGHNYSVTTNNGTLTVLGRDLLIKTGSDSKVYDGAALSCETFESEGLIEGDRIAVINSTQAVDYKEGGYQNEQTVVVFDSSGSPSNNYNVLFEYGTLTINKKPVTARYDDATKIYDGTPLRPSTFTCETLIDGHSAFLSSESSLVNCGSAVVEIDKILIYDDYGVDKTDNYRIETLTSTLKVTKRSITVKPCDAGKEYDGTPLTVTDAEITASSEYALCDGHYMEIVSTKSLTNVGEFTDNSVEKIDIFDAKSNSVSENYEVTFEYGTLKVVRIQLIVGTVGEGKEYDGKEWNKQFEFWHRGNLLETDYYTCECEILDSEGNVVNPVDVGVYSINIKNFKIYSDGESCEEISRSESGTDVILELGDYYTVTLKQTKFTINKKRVYVSTESKTVEYDENQEYENGVIISSDQNSVTVDFRVDAWEETYELPTFENSINETEFLTGTLDKENSFEVARIKFYKTVDGVTVETTANYEIISDFGTLSITRNG